MSKSKGLLTMVCVLAIIFGGLGVLSLGTALVSMVGGSGFQQSTFQSQLQGMDESLVECQRKMQQEIQEVSANRWKLLHPIVFAFKLVLVVGLITGGILALRLRPNGRVLLFGAFLYGLVFELLLFIPAIMLQCETMAVVRRYTAEMMRLSAPSDTPMPPGVEQIMATSMTVGMYLGLVVTVGWFVVKLACYTWGAICLRRPAIKDLFVNPGLRR